MPDARRLCLIALMGITLAAAGVETLKSKPFPSLSKADAATLERGEPIIRSVRDFRALSLAPFDSRASVLLARLAKLKPNYITELLLLVPVNNVDQQTDILNKLALNLADVSGYVKIPYWSVRQQTTYDLFDKMEIQYRAPIDGGESIRVLQHMEPFDDFTALYEYSRDKNALTFSGTNLQPIIYSYRNLKAVAPGGMVWGLYVFAQEGRLYVYGAGVVNAFDLFGLFRDRLEPSFMGRVVAFFKHISGQIHQ
ncbi:MAG: DUF6675 family protein [Candidatus Shapirobacteria bacterium]